MADVKWIKITTDIFDDEKMYAIETQQDGQLMELIWFKLLCLAGKCNNHGFLMINNKIAYTDEMLSKIFRIEIGSVQRALALFEQLEMIEVVENAYMIANWDKHQNEQGLEDLRAKQRERTRRCREKQKQLQLEQKEDCNVTSNVTDTLQSNVTSSLSISNISNSISNKSNNKKSNIKILDIVLQDYDKALFLENNQTLQDCIVEWLKYKDEKKNYYSETGLKQLLNKFIKSSQSFGVDSVVTVVNDSMASNYQGIVWDRIKKTNINATQCSTGNAFIDKWASV